MSQPESAISKSAFLCGVQCPKLLWHAVNTRDLLPEPDAAQQAMFDQGHEVGLLARQLFPGGVQVEGDNMGEAVRVTSQNLTSRKPLFEAAFQASGGFCRVDVLNPSEGEAWDLVEIKSAASVKDVHLLDVAFQAWVLGEVGVPIRRIKLMHVNSDYERCGLIEPQKLFSISDATADASGLVRTVEGKVRNMLSTVRLPSPPEASIDPHCDDPYTCPLHDRCWAFLPEENVLTLYRGRNKGFQLLARGILHLREIPADVVLTDKQAIQKRCIDRNLLLRAARTRRCAGELIGICFCAPRVLGAARVKTNPNPTAFARRCGKATPATSVQPRSSSEKASGNRVAAITTSNTCGARNVRPPITLNPPGASLSSRHRCFDRAMRVIYVGNGV